MIDITETYDVTFEIDSSVVQTRKKPNQILCIAITRWSL